MATTRLMPLHVGKGRNISTAISDIIDYVENPQKTDFGKFIYGYECDTRLADAEFLLSKRQYANLTGRNQGADDVIAYHLRQAFKPGEVTPEEANQIGRELALKLTKGNHAFVVCTHVDKHHVHNHIIINSTTLDCQKKFRNFWGSTWGIRRINDKLCLEHGLSIVENPKPSWDHYGTWLGNKKQPSFDMYPEFWTHIYKLGGHHGCFSVFYRRHPFCFCLNPFVIIVINILTYSNCKFFK